MDFKEKKIDDRLLSVWTMRGRRNNIIASNVKVTFDQVDDAVQSCADRMEPNHIYVWSGVHGDAMGFLAFDEPDFTD